MLRRLLVVTALSALGVAGSASVAAADPSNAKGAVQVQAVCNGQSVTVVVNGNGRFTPGHVVGSTRMFVPTAFNLTFTFTPTGGSPMTELETAAKAGPVKNPVTCTIPLQTIFSGPEGTATIQGTVTGFFTPRKQ